jgi:hypothetical protein
MKVIDYDKDYAGTWINLQAEVKILHHYCLKGDWADAETTARQCAKYATQLADTLKEMGEVE